MLEADGTDEEEVPECAPCWFCGSTKAGDRVDIKFHFYVRCLDCEARGPQAYDRAEAVRAWNAAAERIATTGAPR